MYDWVNFLSDLGRNKLVQVTYEFYVYSANQLGQFNNEIHFLLVPKYSLLDNFSVPINLHYSDNIKKGKKSADHQLKADNAAAANKMFLQWCRDELV